MNEGMREAARRFAAHVGAALIAATDDYIVVKRQAGGSFQRWTWREMEMRGNQANQKGGVG